MTITTRPSAENSRQTINLRATAEQKALIDRAAGLLGKSRTEFMLDTARQAAENVLLDRSLILLGSADYKKFLARLDAPVAPSRALRKLLATPSPWEK